MQADASLSRTTAGSKVWAYGLGAIVVSAVVNVIVLLIGQGAGVAFLVPSPGSPESLTEVGPFMVVMATLVSLGVGTIGTVLLASRLRSGLVKFQIAAGVLTVLSLGGPLTMEDGSTGVWLAAMHLVAGGVFIAALQRAKGASG